MSRIELVKEAIEEYQERVDRYVDHTGYYRGIGRPERDQLEDQRNRLLLCALKCYAEELEGSDTW